MHSIVSRTRVAPACAPASATRYLHNTQRLAWQVRSKRRLFGSLGTDRTGVVTVGRPAARPHHPWSQLRCSASCSASPVNRPWAAIYQPRIQIQGKDARSPSQRGRGTRAVRVSLAPTRSDCEHPPLAHADPSPRTSSIYNRRHQGPPSWLCASSSAVLCAKPYFAHQGAASAHVRSHEEMR